MNECKLKKKRDKETTSNSGCLNSSTHGGTEDLSRLIRTITGQPALEHAESSQIGRF